MRTSIILNICLSATLLFSANPPAQKEKESAIVTITASGYDKEVSDGIVLVDYWATWCPPCRKMNPIIEEIASEYKGKVKVCKLNVDANSRFATAQGVKSIPTLILYQDGEEIGRVAGVVSKQELAKALDQQIAVYRQSSRSASKE